MRFFDAFLPIGRTNKGFYESPCSETEALALMDKYNVGEALVYHTLARDSNPLGGNAELALLQSPRLHPIWAFEPALAAPTKPADFLAAAVQNGARAILVNPCMRDIRIDRSLRILELAALLEEHRIPLLAVYRQWDRWEDIIDWYALADFCKRFPRLPIIAWQWRSRSNRPMFDALAEAENLYVSLSTIWQAQMVESICETFVPERLVFSLGLPEINPMTFPGVLAYADISPAAKDAIAAGTLRKLLEGADYGT